MCVAYRLAFCLTVIVRTTDHVALQKRDERSTRIDQETAARKVSGYWAKHS